MVNNFRRPCYITNFKEVDINFGYMSTSSTYSKIRPGFLKFIMRIAVIINKQLVLSFVANEQLLLRYHRFRSPVGWLPSENVAFQEMDKYRILHLQQRVGLRGSELGIHFLFSYLLSEIEKVGDVTIGQNLFNES